MSGGRRRVEVTWQDGTQRAAAVSDFDYQVGHSDAETIRWYLEDYPEFAEDPGPAIAIEAEARLTRIGTDLFALVFAGPDALGIWRRAQAQLGQVRVEIDADVAEARGLPWELLRDPATDSAVALSAGEFVRTHLRPAGIPSLPEPAGDTLRVLMAICRPGGRADVPFRAVAGRLIRGGGAGMDGLDLDVLRPASFGRLATVLRKAADAGRPYHVVHFDGHGTYLDVTELDQTQLGPSPLMYVAPLSVSLAAPARPGRHGYLIFEDPDNAENQQLVDGPTIGRLLAQTGVPVLILNGCRSAYAQAPDRPTEGTTGDSGDEIRDPGDAHSRIRAYGSLAAEVADAGVPGVAAMAYNVYVVTAAQYVADLYAHLLAGRSLGRAATAARRALAADPVRQITTTAVTLQDWVVPVVYESAPLVLLRPPERASPVIRLDAPGRAERESEVPRPPDAGFFGRDETLLALDRAFDSQQAVLLHAFAGAGKSATAAEFARWYTATGGLDHPEHPEWGPGAVLWSSFEHHPTADRLIGMAGDHFADLLEANQVRWAAITDPLQRRDIMLQVLAQLPVLWIWDNIEPVTGFPAGTPSAWPPAEQEELAGLLRDLAQRTRCKVLLTSRRDERGWLGGLPARVHLPRMPLRESVQLTAAIAARHGSSIRAGDWRPLLSFSEGNPLAISVLTGQALRENLVTGNEIAAFVDRLREGEAEPESGEDAGLGRSRSLAASLSYGFASAFNDAERGQLAVLRLFRGTVDADVLRLMGDPAIAAGDAVPRLAGLTREGAIALLDRAAEIGLLTAQGQGYFQIHPALPWYFNNLFDSEYGTSRPSAGTPRLAYSAAVATSGNELAQIYAEGNDSAVWALAAEEANLLHALRLATDASRWRDALGCLQGLCVLYEHAGRGSEWARLVGELAPAFTAPDTDGPLPGRELEWSVLTAYRARLARDARDWPAAARFQQALVGYARDRAAEEPGEETTRSLSVALESMGHLLREQGSPDAMPLYQEALELCSRLSDDQGEATIAFNLGHLYKDLPGYRDLDQAKQWYRRSLSLRHAEDRLGRARSLGQLGATAYERYQDDLREGQPRTVLATRLNEALSRYQEALDLLLPVDAPAELTVALCQLGLIYSAAGRADEAASYYRRSLAYAEAAGEHYQAAVVRRNLAMTLADEDRLDDSLQYVRAALDGFERIGPGASADADAARELLAEIGRRVAGLRGARIARQPRAPPSACGHRPAGRATAAAAHRESRASAGRERSAG